MTQTPTPARNDIDFEAHNAEAKAVWEAFNTGEPLRVPVNYTMNPRMILLNPPLNSGAWSFADYLTDPEVMLRVQLAFWYWRSHNVLDDSDLGLPQEWPIRPDFQNCYEAMWFGAPLILPAGADATCQPTCPHILAGDKKNLLFAHGLPETLSGSVAQGWEMCEHFRRRRKEGFEYLGRPLGEPGVTGLETDGPFTVAAILRNATDLCADIYEDPDYVHELMTFITESTIRRIRELRVLTGEAPRPECWSFADDSISLLSVDSYREFVLPYHKRLLAELAGAGPHSIHLCGDATRHFPLIKQALHVHYFDTGFPVDFAWLRKTLGPEVKIRGGTNVACYLHGTPAEVAEETRRILTSGILEGRKFVFGEANNMAPGTPVENMDAGYFAAKEFGRYD